jgi:hypothetical protein
MNYMKLQNNNLLDSVKRCNQKLHLHIGQVARTDYNRKSLFWEATSFSAPQQIPKQCSLSVFMKPLRAILSQLNSISVSSYTFYLRHIFRPNTPSSPEWSLPSFQLNFFCIYLLTRPWGLLSL